jgi:hypothetical protein
MLLAAQEGKTVEVLFADHAAPGDPVLAGAGEARKTALPEIDIDSFLSLPLTVEDFKVLAGSRPLSVGGKAVVTQKVAKGRVK